MQGGIPQIGPALEDTGVAQVRHAIHVLLWIQTVANLILIPLQMLRQGAEHEHAVNGGVCIDLINGGQKGFLGHILGKLVFLDCHTHQLGAFGRALFIGQVAGIGAAADDGQGGHYALFSQRGCALHQFSIERIGHFLAQ